jgi:hypothetical protein
MAMFDLVVLIRIASPDRFTPTSAADARLRERCDEQLQRLVTDDALSLDLASLEVVGSGDARVQQVLAAMRKT